MFKVAFIYHENVHRFALVALRGLLFKRERERAKK